MVLRVVLASQNYRELKKFKYYLNIHHAIIACALKQTYLVFNRLSI